MKFSTVLREPESSLFESMVSTRWGREAHVETACSDLEAMQRLYLSGRPSLLCIDVDMCPSAPQTLHALRQQLDTVTLPVLILADGDPPKEQGKEPTRWLRKPCTREDLESAVIGLLDSAAVPAVDEAGVPIHAAGRGIEARKALRRPLKTPCVVVTGGEKIKGLLMDISLTGSRVEVPSELKVSSMVKLIVGIPGTVPLRIIRFKAQVVREGDRAYGLAFKEMDGESRDFVRSYTKKEADP